MTRGNLSLSLAFAAVLGLVLPDAGAFIDLTAGKRLVAREGVEPTRDKVTFRYSRDPSLFAIPTSPLCPTTSALRFVTDTGPHAEQPLDCTKWTVTGSGFRYKAAAPGNLTKIIYALGKLTVKLKGAPYAADPIIGPVGFIETRLRIGPTEYCGRFGTPPGQISQNLADRVTIKGPTGACQGTCGNAIVETSEPCDDGNAVEGDGCDSNCTATACGNGIQTAGEACDDGNAVEGDGCDTSCTLTGCGNGIQTAGEACDDGDLVDGDGCDSNCTLTACGNSIQSAGEECDDGDLVDGDGCDSNCTSTGCGNGIQTAGEPCDDGNAITGDGCRPSCTVELCGDGIHDPQEQCDDGNTTAGDCCGAACAFEAGGSPCTDLDGCTIGDACSGTGQCNGTPRLPWINELDYDDFFAALDDRDEFVEIAGPAGTDLGGYQLLSVEGGPSGTCLTPHVAPFAAVGEANVTTTIPPGTVLGDDTGTGIGFLVVCFTHTSVNVVNLPACDVVLPAARTDSNLMNGYLTNVNEVTCPDGILLRDGGGGYVDSVSYEGIVPNTGTYGPAFHLFPPYSAPRDEGWLAGVSIEKTSSTLERAQSATEWRDPSETATCVAQGDGSDDPDCVASTSSPGIENPLQTLECGSPSAAFLD